MVAFFGVFILVCGVGLAFIGWILLKDSAMSSDQSPAVSPQMAPKKPKKEKELSTSFKRSWIPISLKKWPWGKKEAKPPEDPLAKILSEHPVPAQAAPSESRAALSADEEKHIEKEIDVTIHFQELKEKHERLDHLFKEKGAELEKAQKALETEVRTKKEFNKVKDILEKELKDTKDKIRSVQVELISARTEGEGYKKRITQLETKVTKLEKEILDKEKEIDELLKKQAKLMEDAKKTVSAAPSVPKPPAPVAEPQAEVTPEEVKPQEEPPKEAAQEPSEKGGSPDGPVVPPQPPEKASEENVEGEKKTERKGDENV